MRQLRLFISSPSDVHPERTRGDLVAARLNSEIEGLAQIEVVRWETGFYTADRSFQESIDAAVDNMRATDIVVCILWKRVGSELNPTNWRRPDGTAYESGTVLEVETAVEVSRQQSGAPDVYLFRKRTPITYASETYEAERMQHQLLEAVWKRWTATEAGHNAAGYQHFDDPDDFEAQLELCLRQWLERKGIVVKTVWDRALKGSPFRGLAAFEAEHAPVFFGREVPIARSIAKLRQAEEAGTPFLAVVGASGAGKSSLLRAGLMPRITRPGIIPGIDLWRSALILPAADPLSSLAEALFAENALANELRAGDFRTPELLARCFAAGGEMAVPPIRAALERAARQRAEILHHAAPRPARLLIAIDQVERMFVEADPIKTDAFAEILRALVEQKLATAIVALRSDAYARFQLVPGFVALLETGGTSYNLLPPNADELEDIVTKPLAACHPPLAFEISAQGRSLAEALVADARGGDALPLLQMTLQRLFDAERIRGDGVLRFADYPGIDQAVADTAAEAIGTLGADAAAELPALLTALVGDVAQDAAAGTLPIVVPVDRAAFERGLAIRTALIDAFVAYRLLTAEHSDGKDRVRPTHDALLRIWPEAVRIIDENAALIRVRHTIEPMAADWDAAGAGAKAGYLAISPALLAGAEQLSARFGEDLPPVMRAFIDASLDADAACRNAEHKRQRRVLVGTAIGLVMALILAGLAGWQWTIAEAQKKEAQAQRDRAERSLVLATQTANGLIFDLAQKFRDLGLPAAIVGDILDRVRKLQEQLVAGGETSPDLRRSEAAALIEINETLLTLGDTDGALAAAKQARDIFQSLLSSDPDSTDFQYELSVCDGEIGDVLKARGDLAGALAAYRAGRAIREALALKEPGNTDWQLGLSWADTRIGNVLRAQGDLPGALAAYRDSLAIGKALVLKDPGNTEWQNDLAWADSKIGDVLTAQGDLAGALTAYRDSLAIRKALALRDPGNTRWQDDLGVSVFNIGDVLKAQGDLAGTLAAYRDGLAIIKALALKDPGNTEWQRDLSVSGGKIGDVLKAQGDLAGALDAYRDGLAIRKALALKDPSNTEWQRDLSISDNYIGYVLQAQGDIAGALDAYRDGLAIRRALAAQDPSNTRWQGDLSVSDERIGNVLQAQSDLPGALAAYRDSLAIRTALVLKDPSNALWQRNLSVSDDNIADVLQAQGDLAGALEAYRDGLAIMKPLALKDPGNTEWQRDISISDEKIGYVLQAQGDLPGALAAYRDCLAIRTALALKDPGNTEWQHDLAYIHGRTGDVLQAQGDLAGGLAVYRDGLAIRKALALKDPGNTEWQRDLADILGTIGGVELGVGEMASALAAYEEQFALRRQLHAASATQDAKSALGDALNNLSFALLFNHRPRDALDRAHEALALDPAALLIETNRAHALLFLGRFDEAKAVYLEDKDKPLGDGRTFGDAVRDDFALFRKNGIDTPEMKTIESLLAG
jgi:tetratricopeptide (TPR) repeat protein